MHGRSRLSEPSSAAGTSVAEEAPSRQEKYNTKHDHRLPRLVAYQLGAVFRAWTTTFRWLGAQM
jgi:hypothetical protein